MDKKAENAFKLFLYLVGKTEKGKQQIGGSIFMRKRLQTFITSGYLWKNNCFDNNLLQNREKKWKKIFHSFVLSKYKISKFLWPLLIGQNDALDVLLLDEIYLRFK